MSGWIPDYWIGRSQSACLVRPSCFGGKFQSTCSIGYMPPFQSRKFLQLTLSVLYRSCQYCRRKREHYALESVIVKIGYITRLVDMSISRVWLASMDHRSDDNLNLCQPSEELYQMSILPLVLHPLLVSPIFTNLTKRSEFQSARQPCFSRNTIEAISHSVGFSPGVHLVFCWLSFLLDIGKSLAW